MNKLYTPILLLLTTLFCCQVFAKNILVHDKDQLKQAIKIAQPGDSVVMANKVWNNIEILFKGSGTARKPITLMGQTQGRVIISGKSNLRIAGKHLIVRDLIFKDGYAPTGAVISFRQNKQNLAYNSRVTAVVIDNYNNPERYENDNWVLIYGKFNRFDHNHLIGKRNKGVTLAVRLDSKASRKNKHKIDHNYFGPRPILGANGGETLRIGTSHYAHTNSLTLVENNYFDRCNGELEVISNKSGGNIFRGNVFFESRGTLTMRHGDGTLVEDNVFIGNGKEHTGGIRVINQKQTVRNNYMQGLTGYRLGGGFVVMNGVPNSPANRYVQVKDAKIYNNSIVDVEHIQFAAGSDAERSAVPINSIFKDNLIFNSNKQNNITVFDDIKGINFTGNVVNAGTKLSIADDIATADFNMETAGNNLKYPSNKDLNGIGVSRNLQPIAKADTGVSWYKKPVSLELFGTGSEIDVAPGEGTLLKAIKKADSGATLYLEAGEYTVSRTLPINKAITIIAKDFDPKKKPTVFIEFERPTLFEIVNGGNLKLIGLEISGAKAPDSYGNAVIRTQRRSMLDNYELHLHNVVIHSLNVNHSFNVIEVSKSSFADLIEIEDSKFKNITGSIVNLDKETDDYGRYNSEHLIIKNSSFNNIAKSLVNYYRGGTDESTFGPHFILVNATLNKVGLGKRNKSKAAISLHGVQVANISNNKIKNSAAIKINHTVGEPKTKIYNNKFIKTDKPVVIELNSAKTNTASIKNNTYDGS